MIDESSEDIKSIRRLLEKTLAILKLINSEGVLKKKEDLLQNETKRRIYDLCDGEHTVKDIVSTLGATQPNVSYHLSSLLESGLVLYEDAGGNRYYFRTLE